jgi:DNA-binding transcriptional LysR family regulator
MGRYFASPFQPSLVVTLECLDALDHLIWLRTGARAAEAMGCNQSTISRHASKCQHIFKVKLRRDSAEWMVIGDSELLCAERRLHQHVRWEMNLPLRFEAQHWMRDFYASWQPPGWMKGNLNYLEYARPLDLLRDRIIDAWICGAPDIPDDPDLTCVQLFEIPMLLAAHRDHPLLRRQAPLTLEEVSAYPLLPLPQRAFPVFEAQLQALGLGGPAAEAQEDPSEAAADALPFAERCLGIASALTLPMYGADYHALPLQIPIRFGDVLVIHSDFARHRRSQELRDSLLDHIRTVTAGIPAVRLHEQQAFHAVSTPDQGI